MMKEKIRNPRKTTRDIITLVLFSCLGNILLRENSYITGIENPQKGPLMIIKMI